LLLGGGAEPHAKDYAALMKKIMDRPDRQLLQTMLLRSMQQAHYGPDNMGHFGLAYEAYGHFTSPIRRYPDLALHRVIKAILNNEIYVPSPDGTEKYEPAPKNKKEAQAQAHGRWDKLGLVCSANERRADDASNDVQAWLKCYYMRDRVGEDFSGTISGVAPFGVFVTLDSLYVDGLVHVSELGAEYFQFNEQLHELRGERSGMRFRLTDRIHVQVARVDLEARRIEFRMTRGTQARLDGSVPNDTVAQARPTSKKAAKAMSPEVKQAVEARKAAKLKDPALYKKKAVGKKQSLRAAAKTKRAR
jgi:ribonuclease R